MTGYYDPSGHIPERTLEDASSWREAVLSALEGMDGLQYLPARLRLDDVSSALSALAGLGSDVDDLRRRADSVMSGLEFPVAIDGAKEVIGGAVPPWAWHWRDVLGMDLRRAIVTPEPDRLIAMRNGLRDTLGGLLASWRTRTYDSAQDAVDLESWTEVAERILAGLSDDASVAIEALLVDQMFCDAEFGAVTPWEVADARSGLGQCEIDGSKLRTCARVAVSQYDANVGNRSDSALALFAPPSLVESPLKAMRGDRHAFLAELAGRLGVSYCDAVSRRIPPPPDAPYGGGCIDAGTFADPFWFARNAPPARELVTQAHELGHVLTGTFVRREFQAWLGVVPDVGAEAIAYASEWLAGARFSAARDHSVRLGAIYALGACFVERLRDSLDNEYDWPPGKRASEAWRTTCAEFGFVAGHADEWALLPGLGYDLDLSRLHLVAYRMGLALAHTRDPLEATAELCRVWSDRESFGTAVSQYAFAEQGPGYMT